MTTESFDGAKVALLVKDQLVTILRDDRPDIPFPAHWDFPGGGRETGESPEDCVLREVHEELGLTVSVDDFVWRRPYENGVRTWFFVAEVPQLDIRKIRLGDEGQYWRMIDIAGFLRLSRAVPHMKSRLNDYIAEQDRPIGSF